MTERQLTDMLKLARTAKQDNPVLSNKEIEDLCQSIVSELYALRIKSFKAFLELAKPIEAASEETWVAFYAKSWTIQFDNKSVVIRNGATVYEGLQAILDEIVNHEI